jgi:hypothetical protein
MVKARKHLELDRNFTKLGITTCFKHVSISKRNQERGIESAIFILLEHQWKQEMRGRERSGVRSSSYLNNNGNTNQEGKRGAGNEREWKEKGEEWGKGFRVLE